MIGHEGDEDTRASSMEVVTRSADRYGECASKRGDTLTRAATRNGRRDVNGHFCS